MSIIFLACILDMLIMENMDSEKYKKTSMSVFMHIWEYKLNTICNVVK